MPRTRLRISCVHCGRPVALVGDISLSVLTLLATHLQRRHPGEKLGAHPGEDAILSGYDPSDEAAGTLDGGNVRRQMRKVLAALPADFPKWFTPHSGRHTFASQLLAEGKDLFYVREQLGHESIKLTADTYGSSLPSNPKNTNDCLDDPDWTEASHHVW